MSTFESHIAHFVVSFGLVAIIRLAFGRRTLSLACLCVLLLGIAKEIFDLTFNLNHMTPTDLWADSVGDMIGNAAGIVSAYLLGLFEW